MTHKCKMSLDQLKGSAYEKYVLKMLKPEYDSIWLWRDVPESILIEQKIIVDYNTYSECRKDIGVDILAVKNNVYTCIQCKNYEKSVCVSDISGFLFFMLLHGMNGVLCYSGSVSPNIVKSLREKISTSVVKIDLRCIPFDMLCQDDMANTLRCKPVIRDYQKSAINRLMKYDKCILSMPCGTGKTFTVGQVAKKFNSVVVMSPLRKLASDTLIVLKQILGKEYRSILISSDGERDTTKITNHIESSDKHVISCTYDSIDVLEKVEYLLDDKIFIIDEFHNLSQKHLTSPDSFIFKLMESPKSKIVYMSATPTFDVVHDSIYKYSWEKAISNNYICDFNITIPSGGIMNETNLNKMIDLLNDLSNDRKDDNNTVIDEK